LVAHCPAAATDFSEVRSACLDAAGDPVARRIVVSAIDKAGQATAVGIQTGDILETYSGHEIRSTSQVRGLVDRLSNVSRVLVIRRSNQRMEFALRPGRIGIYMTERFVTVDAPDGGRAGN
jgi:S1-C subfamily serine protease